MYQPHLPHNYSGRLEVWTLSTSSNAMYAMLFTLEKPTALFMIAWMDTVSPRKFRTQTYWLPSTPNPTRLHFKIAGLLASYTNYLIPPRPQPPPVWNRIPTCSPITSHSRPKHPLSPHFHPAPSSTYSLSVLTILLQRKNVVFCSKASRILYFSFHLYVLMTLTWGPDDAKWLS